MIYETIWQTYLEVGSTAIQAGREDVAEQMLNSAIELARSLDDNGVQTAQKLCALAKTYSVHKRVRRALIIFKEALSIFEKILGPHHPNTLSTLEAIAQLYVAHNKLNKALPFYERAARLDDALIKEESRALFVRMLNKLAWIYYTQGKHSESARLYTRAESMATNL
jgi:tetratricopeptide (TPR) repeat protein